MLNQEQKRELLETANVIAVVGLSDKPHRTSYQVSEAMQKAGYTIIPVNPNVNEVLGEKSLSSIRELPSDVDLVNVFRRSEFLPELADDFLETNIPAFWAQLGVFDRGTAEKLERGGKQVVMDACIKVDHALLVKK
ncbi:CoA-binding protein [Alkalicoccus luteus]|uniref:CoA-binding protein n=1 Tax=Alkalicoccus luteus TaxID=1237094 RepID=A0A969TT41_9BACI|nr:CoA-binding protein [Alkalicoccus luteus]NJP37253.1 CoA-binding protein [Alkalicoccus luteus]